MKGLCFVSSSNTKEAASNQAKKLAELAELEKMPFKEWPNDAGFNANVETRKPVELVVHGRIPAGVAGTLYRTGPGHYKVEDTPIDEYKLSHWFDGFTQIHRFQLIANDDGSCKVLYNSRRQVDQLLEKVRKTGRLSGISFGQKRDPCASYFQKLKSIFEPSRTDNPQIQNVGVTITPNPSGVRPSQRLDSSKEAVKSSNFMVVKTDSSQMKSVDMETLEPIGVTNQQQLHPDLKGPLSCAHAQYDPENGDVFNYNLDFGKVCTYRVFKTSPATGVTDILATIADAAFAPAYIHSFFLTHDFVILAVWSSHIASYGISILWERNMLDSISPFDPNSKVKWLVIDRRQGRGVVASFESPAAFSFHSVNAWQEPRSDSSEEVDIFCEVIQYPTLNILHRLYYDNLVSTGPGVSKHAGDSERESAEPSLTRYRLAGIPLGPRTLAKPLKSTSIAELTFQVRSPLIGDLPTINPLHATRRSRYVYSLVDQGYSSFVDGIAKFDTLTKVVVYWMKPKHTPGEAIFVPDSTREGEDAGFLLSVILNGETGTSYLLCLDAKDMKEVGRAEAGVAVGFGFHGTHISS